MACDPDTEIRRSADDVFQVPASDGGTACIRVHSGDKIILPVDLADNYADENFRITEAGGALVIEHNGATVLLQDFVLTLDDRETNPVVVTEADGTPIDLAVWLAISDPDIDITCQ